MYQQHTLTVAQLRTIAEEATKRQLDEAFKILVTPSGNFNENGTDVVVAYLSADGTNLATVTVFMDGSVASGWMAG